MFGRFLGGRGCGDPFVLIERPSAKGRLDICSPHSAPKPKESQKFIATYGHWHSHPRSLLAAAEVQSELLGWKLQWQTVLSNAPQVRGVQISQPSGTSGWWVRFSGSNAEE